MSLLTGLVAGHNASSALVGLVGTRAWPITAQQTPVYPYYTFQRISTSEHVMSHRGSSGLEQVRIQFTPNAKTALEADTLAELLKTMYLGFVGTLDNVFVRGGILASDLDDYDPTTKTYRRMVDIVFWVQSNA